MNLLLSEDITLLGMDDEKGVIVMNATPDFHVCISSAMLIDLYQAGSVDIKDSKIVKIKEPSDLLLSKTYSIIANDQSIADYIKLLEKNDIKDILVNTLTNKGILSKETKKVLFIKKEMFPTDNPDPENETRYALHQVVFNDIKADARVYLLLYFVKSGNLIKEVFRKQTDQARDRIDKILSGDKESSMSLDQIDVLNSVQAAMQKRMMMSV
jgi:hypothetical protein